MTLMSQPHESERRRDPRYQFTRPAKVRCEQTGKFYTARTIDLSAGGALLRVEHPSLMVPGQRVRVGIAWNRPQEALIESHQMLEATIVRSLGIGRVQSVALQFDVRRQTVPLSA